jgi:luxR family transcriptional regulator, regulator of transport and utilization of aryl beta-glucosides
MNNKEVVRSIAIIDACHFTRLAITKICNSVSDKIIIHNFESVEQLLKSPYNKEIDFVFYDALSTGVLTVNPSEDIRTLKINNPSVKVCVFSVLHQFMTIANADHEIDKRVSLDDFNFFARILCQENNERCRRNYSVVSYNRMNLCWEQITLLRAYLLNFNTKDIAKLLDCKLRKVYFFREGAMRKITENKSLFRDIGLLIDP